MRLRCVAFVAGLSVLVAACGSSNDDKTHVERRRRR